MACRQRSVLVKGSPEALVGVKEAKMVLIDCVLLSLESYRTPPRGIRKSCQAPPTQKISQAQLHQPHTFRAGCNFSYAHSAIMELESKKSPTPPRAGLTIS